MQYGVQIARDYGANLETFKHQSSWFKQGGACRTCHLVDVRFANPAALSKLMLYNIWHCTGIGKHKVEKLFTSACELWFSFLKLQWAKTRWFGSHLNAFLASDLLNITVCLPFDLLRELLLCAYDMPWRSRGGVEVQLYPSCSWPLDGGGWSTPTPAALPSAKSTSTHCTGGSVGPGAGLDGCGEEKISPTGVRTPNHPAFCDYAGHCGVGTFF